ncbi:hypothetical protein Dimus_022937, partial [Dionaea muscipula]
MAISLSLTQCLMRTTRLFTSGANSNTQAFDVQVHLSRIWRFGLSLDLLGRSRVLRIYLGGREFYGSRVKSSARSSANSNRLLLSDVDRRQEELAGLGPGRGPLVRVRYDDLLSLSMVK